MAWLLGSEVASRDSSAVLEGKKGRGEGRKDSPNMRKLGSHATGASYDDLIPMPNSNIQTFVRYITDSDNNTEFAFELQTHHHSAFRLSIHWDIFYLA
jgi:hypothetical protein